MGKKITICNYCGKTIVKSSSSMKKYKKHYCGSICQKAANKEKSHEIRKCMYCKRSFETTRSNPKKLCSVECQHKWQRTRTGKQNPRYTKELVHCDYCNKEYYIARHKVNNRNKFCSKQCRQDWYSNIWSQRDDWKKESRRRAARLLQTNTITTDTVPQKSVNKMLNDLQIKFTNEEVFGYYSIDNYLLEENLMIEVMGDYWHSNPMVYSKERLNEMQKKRIPKDKSKHSYIRNKYGIEILYLWEHDIENDPKKCTRLIEEYVQNGGFLRNYNSFNYVVENGRIKVKGKIIHPYFAQ